MWFVQACELYLWLIFMFCMHVSGFKSYTWTNKLESMCVLHRYLKILRFSHLPSAATPVMDPTATHTTWPDVKPCGSPESSLRELLGWICVVDRSMDVEEENWLVCVESDSVLTDIIAVVPGKFSTVVLSTQKTTEKNKKQSRALNFLVHST